MAGPAMSGEAQLTQRSHSFARRSSYLSDRRARVVLATDAHVEPAVVRSVIRRPARTRG